MPTNSYTLKISLTAVCIAALAGCTATQEKIATTQAAADLQASQSLKAAQSAAKDTAQAMRDQQDVAHPFLVGKTLPLAREVSISEHLRKRVTVLFDRGGVDLLTAVRQISEAARLPISVTQDAMLPMAMFGPRIGGTTGAAQSPAGGVPMAPMATPPGINSPAARIHLSAIGQNIEIFRLLDEVTRQAGVSWRNTPTGGVEIYRTETRVFRINVSPYTASTAASLGRNNSNSEVFEVQSKTGFLLDKQDPFGGIRTTVEAMLSTGGRITTSTESQTLVVTDTPEVLDRVSKYIETTNATLTRRIRVVVEAIEVISKDKSEYGFDWNLVFQSVSGQGLPAARINPLGSLASAISGTTSVTGTSGRFDSSSVAIRALNEVGTIVNRKSFPFVTTSGRPITQALRNTFSYVNSASVTQSSTVTTIQQAPTVTQKEETVGTFLTVTPIARDSGHMFLNFSYDVTTADPLTSFTVGSSTNSVTVQQKSINGTGIVQEIPMRSGQTVIVGGYDSVVGNLTQRRVAPGSPMLLGGSDAGSYQKSVVVFLVTAVIEDGY